MNDPNEELNELMARFPSRSDYGIARVQESGTPPPPQVSAVQNVDLCQWQISPNGVFRPAAKTVPQLSPGAYSTGIDAFGPYLTVQPLLADDIIELPESANVTVLAGIQKFWGASDRYLQHGLVFKRGVLLWGPPGSGKTVTIHLLAKDLIARGGIVLFCGAPNLMLMLLSDVRRIEANRPLIVVLEDIDEIISNNGEHSILSMLDGENQTDNVVYVATSNYPERLGARIVNRPSRFDERVFVGMPSLAARVAYLQKAGSNGSQITASVALEWAHLTDGLSIAHLRELIAAVRCLDQDFADVLKRLKSMNERPKEIDGFRKKSMGYGNQPKTAASVGSGLLR